MPGSLVSGNLLLCFFSLDGAPGTLVMTGWTQLFSANAPSTADRSEVWYRVSDATEGADESLTWDNSEKLTYNCYQINGQHGSSAPEAGTAANGTSGAADPPSLTPSWGAEDTLWFVYALVDGNSDITVWPTSYTVGQVENEGDGSAHASHGIARRELNGTTDNPSAFTNRNTNWISNLIGIRPLVAGGGGGGGTITLPLLGAGPE
jgi:hypothetical protein